MAAGTPIIANCKLLYYYLVSYWDTPSLSLDTYHLEFYLETWFIEFP